MRQFIFDAWNGVMNAQVNPLRHIDDLQVRHFVVQILAWMWCLVFSLYISSWTIFGITAIAHMVFIAAVVITVGTFATAQNNPKFFNFKKGYHSMGRSRGSVWVDGKKVDLPPNDPGGEHE